MISVLISIILFPAALLAAGFSVFLIWVFIAGVIGEVKKNENKDNINNKTPD